MHVLCMRTPQRRLELLEYDLAENAGLLDEWM
jgi:hypothetical protein